MIRCRFYVALDDFRPISWPIKHPYWCTGYTADGSSVLVAYADDEAEILRLWPEATHLDSETVDGYIFTSRFRKPDWFEG